MKTLRVVSVSLGSSKRNHLASTNILGKDISVERIGTDGSFGKAIEKITALDGRIDAIGMGGIDLYFYADGKRYTVRDALKLTKAAKITPIVDGSGLKDTLERQAIEYLQKNNKVDFKNAKVLMVSAVDRFGMAETLHKLNADILFGDLIFGLNIPIPVRKMSTFKMLAKMLLPIVTKMPFKMLYPTGSKQEKKYGSKYSKYYDWADIIAGDYHFVKKYMPENLENKIIITNTVTKDDVETLRKAGLKTLITTTPEIQGRSFGTNVMEAIFVSVIDKPYKDITSNDYMNILGSIDYKPRIVDFSNYE